VRYNCAAADRHDSAFRLPVLARCFFLRRRMIRVTGRDLETRVNQDPQAYRGFYAAPAVVLRGQGLCLGMAMARYLRHTFPRSQACPIKSLVRRLARRPFRAKPVREGNAKRYRLQERLVRWEYPKDAA
jgi:hypothetical protein